MDANDFISAPQPTTVVIPKQNATCIATTQQKPLKNTYSTRASVQKKTEGADALRR